MVRPSNSQVCDRVPALADVFAETARALRAYAHENQVDVAELNPYTIVTGTSRVVVELNPPEPS